MVRSQITFSNITINIDAFQFLGFFQILRATHDVFQDHPPLETIEPSVSGENVKVFSKLEDPLCEIMWQSLV